ncbi:O-antigen ligase family protein [Achromobacter aegrifaciens]
MLILLPFLLLFIGDMQVPVGVSKATIPMGMFIVFPLLFMCMALPRIVVPTTALLLLGTLFFGAIGALLTPESEYLRALAGALPLLYAICTLMLYAQFYRSIKVEWAVRMMLAGGAVLALVVIGLFIVATLSPGNYYEQKLLIETPLGRSNYLAAFLIFLFALALTRSWLLPWLFAIAVFCTMSRGGILMFLFFLVALHMEKRRLLWLAWLVPLLAFVVATLLASAGFHSYIQGYEGAYAGEVLSATNRLLLWSFGFDIWVHHPWFGIGPNTFRTFIELSPGIENVWGAHNSVIQMLLNYGLFGTILYCLYIREIYMRLRHAELTAPWFRYLRVVFVVLQVFGLFEPLVGSAAFEVLLVFILILASRQVSPPARIG